jgi:hypothetical protein
MVYLPLRAEAARGVALADAVARMRSVGVRLRCVSTYLAQLCLIYIIKSRNSQILLENKLQIYLTSEFLTPVPFSLFSAGVGFK